MIQFIKLTQNWSIFVGNTTIHHYCGISPRLLVINPASQQVYHLLKIEMSLWLLPIYICYMNDENVFSKNRYLKMSKLRYYYFHIAMNVNTIIENRTNPMYRFVIMQRTGYSTFLYVSISSQIKWLLSTLSVI